MRLNRSDYRTVQPLGIEFLIVSFVPVPSGRRLATERADAPRRAVGGACGAERITVRRPVRPNEAASTAEDPFPDRRNHVSDTERVKSVCWRGSPDPLQRPRSTGCWEEVSTEASRGRARFAVVHIDQVEETTLSKGRRAACAETTQHSYREGAREGQLPLPNTPSGTDDAGGRRRAAPAGRPPARPLLLSRAVAASLCASPARPPRPNGLGALGACVSIPSGRRLGTERTPARGTAR